MTAVIITGTTALLFGILFLLLAISFLNGKNKNLIAGYNSMTESEKKQFDEKSIGKANGKTMLIISVITIIFSCISFLFAFYIISKPIFIFSVVAYIVAVTLFTILSMIKSSKF